LLRCLLLSRTRLLLLRFGLLTQPVLRTLSAALADILPEADSESQKECQDCRAASGEQHSVPPPRLLEAISRAGRSGDHRLIIQVAFEIGSEAVRSVVSSGAIFFQTLHYDPDQIAVDR
jgi:hypothetical protein